MKDKVKELSNLGLKAFKIGAGDKEVFADDDSSVGDRTVGESFGVCCPGLTSNFLFLGPQTLTTLPRIHLSVLLLACILLTRTVSFSENCQSL